MGSLVWIEAQSQSLGEKSSGRITTMANKNLATEHWQQRERQECRAQKPWTQGSSNHLFWVYGVRSPNLNKSHSRHPRGDQGSSLDPWLPISEPVPETED